MNAPSKKLRFFALAVLLPLAACNRNTQQVGDAISPSLSIQHELQENIDKVKQELQVANVNISDLHLHNFGNGVATRVIMDVKQSFLPKAEISPLGDLLIDDKKIHVTPQQRTLLLDYRRQIIELDSLGLDIGALGAAIGVASAKNAIGAISTGKDDKLIEASIKTQTDEFDAETRRFCSSMPDLFGTQQKLIASLPEIKPYATMTQKDVSDCIESIVIKIRNHQ